MTAAIVLGSAQFGNAYGITNAVGRLSDSNVDEVVRTAAETGIEILDTAFAYGDAEERLGKAIERTGGTFRAITKLAISDIETDGLATFIRRSRERLRCDRVDILLHRPDDVYDRRFSDVYGELLHARDEGLIEAFGVSVYDATDLEAAVDAMPDFNLVQIPGSIVDRRLLDVPLLAQLADRGVEVHVRSLFLQGLLLAAPNALPAQFAALAPALTEIDNSARRLSTSRMAVLIGAIATNSLVDCIVVGATSSAQLRQITQALSEGVITDLRIEGLSHELLDPRRWAR